jgi:SAM-dependent methyltransferase
MKQWVADTLICPKCLMTAVPLTLTIRNERSGDIIEGDLNCPNCGSQYPIQKGVAVVLPHKTRVILDPKNSYNAPEVLSAYLWSHFGDLLNENHATDAYRVWSSHLPSSGGDALDVGCAVGRLSFELGQKHDHVIGLDTSISFIRKAREILNRKQLAFNLITEGFLTEPRNYCFDESWNFETVDFIVADALALPFRPQTFATVTAINLIDKVPHPLKHLEEVNRVLRWQASAFLFSDPFSWDPGVAPPERWLGGNGNRHYNPRGIDTIRQLFSGKYGVFDPPLTISDSGDVLWKIRKTQNLWEHITSQYLIGQRP